LGEFPGHEPPHTAQVRRHSDGSFNTFRESHVFTGILRREAREQQFLQYEDDGLHAAARAISSFQVGGLRRRGGARWIRSLGYQRSPAALASQRRALRASVGDHGGGRTANETCLDRAYGDLSDISLQPGRGGGSICFAESS